MNPGPIDPSLQSSKYSEIIKSLYEHLVHSSQDLTSTLISIFKSDAFKSNDLFILKIPKDIKDILLPEFKVVSSINSILSSLISRTIKITEPSNHAPILLGSHLFKKNLHFLLIFEKTKLDTEIIEPLGKIGFRRCFGFTENISASTCEKIVDRFSNRNNNKKEFQWI